MTETEAPAQDLRSTAEKLTEHVTEYVETYIQLTTVKATQKATAVATLSLTAVLISFFGLIIMVFLGLGLAEMFSESMSPKEGYFLVTLIYTATAAIVLIFRKKLIFPVLRNKIIQQMYENKD